MKTASRAKVRRPYTRILLTLVRNGNRRSFTGLQYQDHVSLHGPCYRGRWANIEEMKAHFRGLGWRVVSCRDGVS